MMLLLLKMMMMMMMSSVCAIKSESPHQSGPSSISLITSLCWSFSSTPSLLSPCTHSLTVHWDEQSRVCTVSLHPSVEVNECCGGRWRSRTAAVYACV